MTWILGVLVVIAGTYVIGYFLPVTMRGSGERTVTQTPDMVFRAVLDGQNFPMNADMVKAVHLDGDGRWREELGNSEVRVETVEAKAPVRVLRRYSDSKYPIAAETEILIAPAQRGTYVAVSTRITLVNGHVLAPVLRLLLFGFKGVQKGVVAYLDQLEKGLNQGKVAPLANAAE